MDGAGRIIRSAPFCFILIWLNRRVGFSSFETLLRWWKAGKGSTDPASRKPVHFLCSPKENEPSAAA